MKKKIINGILLVAFLVAASSAFVSCKDNDADSQTELLGKIANLESQIKNLQQQTGPQGPAGKDGVDGKDGKDGKDGVDGKDGKDGKDGIDGSTYDDTAIKTSLDSLSEVVAGLKFDADLTDYAKVTYVNEEIGKVQDAIDKLKEKIATLKAAAITGIEINKISNPLFALDTPVGIESKLLIALFGEVKKDVYFYNPVTQKREEVAPAGKITTGKAGNLYLTLNPFTTDFSGKLLKLVNTAGEEAPVTLTGLQASDAVLTRAGSGLYVTTAEVSESALEGLEFTYIPEDMEDLKETIKTALKERDKVSLLDLASKIYNTFAGNSLPLYQLKADWEDGSYLSKADINVISLKPFSYDFDLNDAAEYNEDNITALEALEEYVVETGTKTASTQSKIWRFLNRVNPTAKKFLDNINWAIQPTLLIDENGETWHPAVGSNVSVFTRFKAGEIKLIPTSWSGELVAPAYKKFVGIIEVDGSSDPEVLAAVNTGNVGKLVDGSVKEIPLTIEAGKRYKIQYSAIDYNGRIKNLYYNIRGVK